MENKTLVYKVKVEENLKQSYTHLKRLNDAFSQLQSRYEFPINKSSYLKIMDSIQDLAFSDQIIYRLSKLQLEKIDVVNVDEWFELRDLRNEIAHDYENSDYLAIDILNSIFESKEELEKILVSVTALLEYKDREYYDKS